MKEFVGLRAKTLSTKKCIIKRKLKFEDYKNCLEEAQIENKIKHLEKTKIDILFQNFKIPNKRELQQIAFNHSSDIDFQDFMNLYKECTTKPYSFLVIDTTLASDNSSRFRKNLLERIQKLMMTIDDKIKDEKLQYDVNREVGKYQHCHQVKLINMNFFTS